MNASAAHNPILEDVWPHLPAVVAHWLDEFNSSQDGKFLDELEYEANAVAIKILLDWDVSFEGLEAISRRKFVDRLVQFFAYHYWREVHHCDEPITSACLTVIVENLTAGRLVYGKFGVNLVREVVLAEACCQQIPCAIEVFIDEYHAILKAIAHKIDSNDSELFFNGFEVDLIYGTETKRPKLLAFAGRTPILPWLQVVMKNHWISYLQKRSRDAKKHRDRQLSVLPVPNSVDETGQDADWENCRQCIKELLNDAIATITDEDLRLLCLVHLEGWRQDQVAKIWKVDGSTISRRLAKILQQIRQRLTHTASVLNQNDCLQLMYGSSGTTQQSIGHLLAQTLRGGLDGV